MIPINEKKEGIRSVVINAITTSSSNGSAPHATTISYNCENIGEREESIWCILELTLKLHSMVGRVDDDGVTFQREASLYLIGSLSPYPLKMSAAQADMV